MSLARPDLLRRLNERRVLELVRTGGACSRADITRRTGISPPTVSRLVSSLLEAGVLEEFDVEESRIGRPSKQLRLSGARVQVLGAVVDVHETTLVAAALNGDIASESRQVFATPSSYRQTLRRLAEGVQTLENRVPRTLGLGVSVPGLIDEEEGRLLFSPNLHQTDGHCLAADLAEVVKLPVTIIQESRALCLAERLYGRARELRDFLIVDADEGVGVGMVTDGRILTGRNGFAGEFGHMTVDPQGPPCGCGNRGCLETRASTRAFAQAAARLLGRTVPLAEAIQRTRDGDRPFRELLDDTLSWLALGVATLVNGFNPEAVFLHSPLLTIGDEVLTRLTELTRGRALRMAMQKCQLLPAWGCKEQGAIGAAIERLVAAHGPVLGNL